MSAAQLQLKLIALAVKVSATLATAFLSRIRITILHDEHVKSDIIEI